MNMDQAAATELRAMRGAWSSLRGDWDLDRREALAILQADDDGRVLGAATETRMRILLEIGYRLDLRTGGDALRERLRRPTPAFGGSRRWRR